MASPLFYRRIADLEAAITLFAPLAAATSETVAFAYLDPEWTILGMRHVSGARDWIAPSIRVIAGDALAFGATGIVMAHNHPSGDPTPSTADLDFTRLLARSLDALGIRLFDHLILARAGSTSLRVLGQL